MPPAPRDSGRSAGQTRAAIERFLKASKQPALLEPGEELLRLEKDNFVLQSNDARLMIQAWDEKRNFVRRITGVHEESRGRLELVVERFARKEGRLFLIDLSRPTTQDWERRGTRLVFREQFRQFLGRQFPDWQLAELSAEADLEHSISPVYPRALLKKGHAGWAAIAALPNSASPNGILSFGLIWLDYLRHREKRLTLEGLALFLPCGHARTTCLRLPFLDPQAAQYAVFTYSEQGFAARLDARDYGNLQTGLENCRRPDMDISAQLEKLRGISGLEQIEKHDGSVSLRIRGIEFARAAGGEVMFGLAERSVLRDHNQPEFQRLALELAHMRSPSKRDQRNPLYSQHAEAWLESQVRAQVCTLDASLLPQPVYGQVPAFAGGERGLIDLLAVDTAGRLAVLELKASADLHLPLQALDYWMRVKWHLDQQDFSARGYFPGIELRREPPRLLLISPALEFHPATETVLSYFAPWVDVERIGLGVEWRKRLTVMFRMRGAKKPL